MPNLTSMSFKSAVICIGNELLLGQTLNSNLAYLGSNMADLGIPVEYSVTIQDDHQAIIDALAECWNKYDVIISTGGLGPTQDDVTKNAIAAYFGKDLCFHEDVYRKVQDMFSKRELFMPSTNRTQAMVPEGFTVLDNARGTAPGLYYGNDGKHLFVLQGVPLEMQYVFENHIQSLLLQAYPQANRLHIRNIHTYGIAESALAELLHLEELPQGVKLAWLPQTGRVDLRLYGSNRELIRIAEDYVHSKVSEYIWGYDHDSPAGMLIHLLKAKSISLAVAESCTGGLVQRLITDVSGASKVFVGGVVSYDNRIKTDVLHVKTDILERHGAVSECCARAMARGVKALCNTDVSIAITGIAGPDGGSAKKPVGTVYFGWQIGDKEFSMHKVFTGDRESIRFKASEAAILELIKTLRSF